MKNDFVLVFDIGSSKIRAMVAKKGVNNTFIIKTMLTWIMMAFMKADFLTEKNFHLSFHKC